MIIRRPITIWIETEIDEQSKNILNEKQKIT